MQKKQFLVLGLILIGVIVLVLMISLLLKKEKNTRVVFQKDIVANLKDGYSVKDTLFGCLDGKNQHVVAIIHWEAENGLDRQDSLVVFELRGDKLVEIFYSTEWIFELGNELIDDYVRAEDINQDNLKEFIVRGGTGGNCWTCEYLRVFQVSKHKVFELLSNLPETQVIYRVIDLDMDGIKELVVLDAEWEFYMELCHACSPSVDVIYDWKKDRYKEASIEFPFYYEEKIQEIERQITEMGVMERGSDYFIGKAISIFLNYIKKGEKERGWEVFKKYMTEEDFKDKSFKNMARDIVKNLERRFF